MRDDDSRRIRLTRKKPLAQHHSQTGTMAAAKKPVEGSPGANIGKIIPPCSGYGVQGNVRRAVLELAVLAKSS